MSSLSENQADFRAKVLAASHITDTAIRECYGVSNSAKFIPNGFLCGIPNLDSLSENTGSVCIFSKIQLSPRTELHTALVFRENYSEFYEFLTKLRKLGESNDKEFSSQNNNCAVFLMTDGLAYCHNKVKQNLELDLDTFSGISQGVKPDFLYIDVYGKEVDAKITPLDHLSAIAGSSYIELLSKNITIPVRNARGSLSKLVNNSNLTKALLTKPFLILTGPSGTGKTRGAVELAGQVCEIEAHRLVAVGADWTDNRHVLGYLNPLETVTEEEDVFPIYETTPILDLILHADANPDEPHVLILDEMNLSHVERYFADFLSAMELKDKSDALKLHSAGMARSRTGAEIQGSIDFPANLFVIGTVNIDETTYMFSPKVLDRANVIEIHAGETEMGNFLKDIETARPEEAAKDYGIAFLDAARVIQGEGENAQVPALPTAVRDAAAEHLMTLFKIMARGRAEYGFRTGKEVKAYLRTAHFLAGPEPAARAAWAAAEGDWLKALDAQILQKILPKLHGSRTRLAPLLGALATYCATGTEEYAMEHFPRDGAIPKRGLKDATGNENPKFSESYKKLERMIAVLVEEQFVSFIC